ncbi:MAG: asparagine synthetase B [Halovenus sp.]
MRGADTECVRHAYREADPLPGTGGFAGMLDGKLVRDVLGRYPLFHERDDISTWAREPAGLGKPVRVPAGHARGEGQTERVWALPDPDPVDGTESAVGMLRDALDTALARTGTDGCAIGFSGGLDSALLAARLDCPLYTVGFPDSHDVDAARSAAALLGCDLTVVELGHRTLERAVPDVAAATGRTNAMDVGIALPLFLVAKEAAADGFDRIVVGQGADELFGGYAKVAKAPDDPRVEAGTVRGARRELLATVPDQLERDTLAVRAADCTPVTPLLHDRVVATGLRLPGGLLVTSTGERKWALRLAARQWLPDRLAFREKKAVQYGSLVARELDRLARQAGFKRRLDDHVTQYIESRTLDEKPHISSRK